MKKRGLLALILGMAVMSFTILNSCDIDIGLGSAVDTEPPVLKIENPPALAVIRDKFVINGTWTDDGSISDISIELRNTSDEDPVIYTFKGKFDDKNNWSAEINPLNPKQKIPDGKYEATIIISDNGGHHSISNRTFVIDNTKPVVILQRPSTTDNDNDADVFGQKFTLTGQAADGNDIVLVRINFFETPDCSGEPVHFINIPNVPPTIDLDVATFQLDVDNDYSAIYGSSQKDGKKRFYFTIEAYDGARRYTGEKEEDLSEEDKLGNLADYYYPYESVFKLVSQYKATGLYNILNGTYNTINSRNISTDDESYIRNTLADNENPKGRFVLNPSNNPEFKIVGRDALLIEDGKIDFSKSAYSLLNESNITLKVAMGLDSIPIIKDSLKIYMLECNDKGEVEDSYYTDEETLKRVYTNRIYPASDSINIEGNGGDYMLTAKLVAENCENYKGEKVTLKIKGTYIIGIEGYDEDNNEAEPEDGNLYGFMLAPNGTVPVVDVNLPATIYNGSNIIRPSIMIQSNQKPFTLVREVFDSDNNLIDALSKTFTKDDAGMAELSNDNPEVEDSIAISPAITASGKYKIVYTVKDKSDKEGENKKTVTVDLTSPQIKTVQISGENYDSAKWYNSKTLSVGVLANDIAGETGIDTVSYSTNGTAWTALSYDTESQMYSGSTVFGNEGATNSLYIRAKDLAGNLVYFDNLTANGSLNPAFVNVKIDSSAPNLGNTFYYQLGDLTAKESSGQIYVDGTKDLIVYGKSYDEESGLDSTKPLIFTIGETTVLPTSITYAVSEPASGSNMTGLTYGAAPSNTKTIKYWKATFAKALINSSEKCGTLKVKVKNIAGHESAATSIFNITFDFAAPVLSNVSFTSSNLKKQPYKQTQYSQQNQTVYFVNNKDSNPKFKISGIATDNCGVNDVTLKIGTTNITRTSTSLSEWVFDDIDLSAYAENEVQTAVVTVSDLTGNSASSSFIIKFDVTNPKAMHWADAKNKDIYFRFGSSDNDKDESGTSWETGDAVNSTNASFNEDVGKKYSYGSWGNDSTIEIRGNFYEAESGSGLKAIHYAIFDEVPTEEQILKLLDGTLVKSGSVKVVNTFAPLAEPVVKKVPYNKNTTGAKSVKEVISNFRTTLSGFDSDSNYLVLVAEDNVGNRALDTLTVTEGTSSSGENVGTEISDGTSSWNSENHNTPTAYYNINKDTQAPVISSDAINLYTNGEGDNIELSGTAFDALSGLSNVTVTIEELNFNQRAELNNGSWSTTIPVSYFNDASVTTGRSYSVYAKATDNAGIGNSKQVSAGTIIIDKTAPVAKINTSASITKDTVTLSGTVNDGTGAGLSDEKLILYYTKSESLGSLNTAPASLTIGTSPADAATKWVELAQINSAADWSYNAENITSITDADENTTLYFTFAAKDASGTGNIGYAKPCSILVDRKKPELEDSESGIGGKTGVSDITNFWFNSKTLRLEGEYSDAAGSGVTTISYNINNAVQTTNIQTTDGTYSINISDFVDGSNTLKIWATDKAGNVSAETTYSFNVDSITPVITSITGADTTKESDVNLTINITDENPIVPEVKLKRANALDYLQTLTASAPVASGSIYTSTVTVPFADAITDDGIYDIDVISKDKAGNTSAVFTKRIVRDHVAPTITITKPDTESAGFTKYANYKFEGTITDVTSGISEATATLCTVTGTSSEPIYTPVKDAETISPDANGNWVFQAYELGAADYVIKVNAKDIANNAAVEKISYIVKIDSEPPVLTVSASGLNDSDGNVATTLSNGVTYYAKGNYSIDVFVDDFNYEYATSGTYSNLTTITATDSNNADVELKEIEPETTENNKTKLKIEPKYGSDGLFTYKIVVKDKADNTANPVTIKVQKDLTGPTIEIKSPAADITDPEKSLDADNYLFRINVSDGIGVGVAKLFYAFTQSDSEPAADSSEWVEKLFSDGDMILDMPLNSGTSTTRNENGELTSLCEGSWHLYAKAIDKAGNETASVVSKAFLIDKAAPVVKESMITPYVKKTSANNGKVTLGGSITESHGVNSFKVTRGTTVYEIVKNGSVQTVPAGSSYSWTYTSSGSDITWILNDYPGDGTYAYRIEAEDLVGKTTTVEKNVTVDTSVPTVSTTESLFTVPTASQSEGDLFKFEGKTGSVADVGSGIDKVELAFTTSNTTEPTTAQISVTPSPTGVWASTVEFANTEFSGVFNSQGKKYLWVKAYDKAENASEWTNVKSFNYDKASPSIETKLDSALITESTKQVKTSAYTFKFKPSDSSYKLAESNPYAITVKKNSTLLSQGENGYTVSTTTDSDGFYEVEIKGSAAGDGTYEYSITANDWAEKTTSVTRIVQLDSKAPVLAVITPDLSENVYQNSTSIKVNGSSTDDSGTSAVYYKFTGSAEVPSVPTSETTKSNSWTTTGWTAASGTTSWEISDLLGVEGNEKYLYLAAVDANGLVSKVTTGYIKVDTANPTSTTATNALITNKTVTLTGIAWDKNAIKSIKISDGTKTYSTDDANPTITLSGSPGTLAEAVSDDAKVTWTKTFAVGSATGAIADGNYTFTITVEDKAGKQSIKTREVTIDTTVPKISTQSVDNGTNGAIKVAYNDGQNDWYNTNQIPVIVTLYGDLSGISSVQVSSKVSTENGQKKLENPTSLILSDGKWKGNVTCETQGLNNIYIKATDAAGNSNEISISNAIPVYIDTVAPQAPIFLGADTTPASEITSLLVNKKADVTVYAALNDDGTSTTGISADSTKEAFKQKGKTGTSKFVKRSELPPSITLPSSVTDDYTIWSYSIKTADMTTGGINFTVKDNAGNSADYTLFQMVVDTLAPTVTFDDIANLNVTRTSTDKTVYVNGTIELKGTASDDQKLASLTVKYKKAESADEDKNWTTITPPENASLTSWTRTLDTTTLEDETLYDIRVSASDAAGWSTESPIKTVKVSQNTDRPVITLSQLAKNTITTLRVKNVYGSVIDDDGTLEKLWYWNGATAPTTAPSYNKTNTTWTVPTGWNEIEINGSSWSIDSTEEDGQTTWYFAVADANKEVFATLGTDKLPYIKYTDETDKVDGTADGVTFKYDTNPPTADSLYLYRAVAGTTTSASDLADQDVEDPEAIAWTQAQNLAFGHAYNVLYAKIVVTEGTGMKALKDTVAATETSPAEAMSSPISISYKNLEFSQIEEVAGTGTAAGTYTYYLGPITMNTTQQHDFKVTVEDAVGNKGYISRSIIVDNEAPTSITEVKPKSTVEISDVFTYRGNVSDNTGGSGVTKLEWYIPKSTESDATVNTITWKEASLSAGWEIDFSGDNNLSKIINYIPNGTSWTVDSGYSSYETSSGSGVYAIPVWFKITDAVGNVGYNKANAVRYNPNTDRPSVQITSPSHNKTATIVDGNNSISIDYAIMGGSAARISGNADDNEGIEAIYLQFDLDDDGKWDNGVATLDGESALSTDLNALPGDNATLINGCPWTKDDIEEIKYNDETSTGYFGIKVSGTKNWSYTVDFSSTDLLHITETKHGEEPNVTFTYEGKTIKVRAIAVDNDTSNGQLVSAPSAVINISVNNDIPLFSNLKVKQINTSNTVLSEDDYTDGKFLTGENWYITGDVYAYGGISSANYTGVTDASSYFSPKVDSEGKKSETDFDMKIPVIPDSNGQWKVRITVYDTNESGNQPNIQDILIHIDNDPPTFNDTYAGTDVTTYGTAKHYLNSYGSRGTLLTPNVKIQDTNGLSSIWGKVTDTGSGFDKAVFYFKRYDVGGTANPRIYNPMEQTNNRTNIESSASVGKVYINADKLPALVVKNDTTAKMTVTRPEENDCTIQVTLGEGATVSGIAGNKNVRKGGLIKIGGVYRTITDVDYTSGIVTFNPPCDRSFVTAEIIYAMVVDSTGETMTGNTINEEDGDGMQENFSDVSGTVTWNAAIPTGNIPDGPVELHVVVFDTAGNNNEGTTKTAIENKPLRITKVMLGTNFNGNTTYDYPSEFETFYALTTTSGSKVLTQGTDIWNLDTKDKLGGANYFTAKNGLAVVPEFVGGTGDVYYAFAKTNANKTTPDNATTTNKLTDNKVTGTVTVEGSGNKVGQLVLDNTTIGTTSGENAMNYFNFSFWDSTEGATPGTDSSWTILNAQIYQDLVDDKNPNIVIEPFRWAGDGSNEANASNTTEVVRKFKYSTVKGNKGYADNFFYTDEACTVKVGENPADDADVYTKETVSINSLYNNLSANGHIDLSGNLPTDKFTTSTTTNDTTTVTTGEYDRDPKVSGKITFSGTAYDNVGLSSLWFSFDGFTPTNYYSTTDKYGTSGSNTINLGTTETPNNKTFYQAAYYNKDSSDTDKWQKASSTIANGWEFTVTDEYFNQNGHKVRWTLSIDTSKISNTAGTDKTLYMLAVDHNAETDATTRVSAFTAAATDSQKTADEGTNNVPSYKVDVVPYITGLERVSPKTSTHRSKKGKYQVVLNESVKITGFNLPGTTANAIKLQTTSNNGTDTVKTQIKADSATGTSDMTFKVPATSGYIRVETSGVTSLNNVNSGNSMVNPDYAGDEWTDDVYLSVWKNDEYFYFSNDPISPSMDRIKYNNTNGDARYRLYGGWATQGSKFYASYPNTTGSGNSGNAPSPATGDSGTSTSSQGFGDPATFYDVAVVGQNRYNVLVDCWQGNTNGWGRNFVINYNGYYSHNGCATDFNNSNSNSMRHVIERMGGGGTAPDNADSSDGFDEIFNQFLNPRITVYEGEAYITYYDRYAKCLKWAMSKPSAANNTIAKKYATEGIWNNNTYQTNAADSNNKSAYYKNGGFVVAGYDTLQSGGSQTNLNVGMWSDIAIDTTAVKPVIAYYDGTNRQLMIATSASATYPVNTNSPVLTGTATSATQGNAWTRQIVTGSTALRLGEYVSLALDGGNNIHIACKSAKEGALYYVYGARTAYGSYTWTTVCVDKNGSPGNWTDIKLTNPGSSGAAAGPVISYYDPTNDASEDALKVAYLESTTSNAAANWDNMTVPCNTAAIANRITLALDVTDGASIASQATTTNNSKLAIGYVSSRFDCVYLRKE